MSWWQPLFRKKPLERSQGEGEGLIRALGAFGLVAIGVGATIGSGIFVTTGEVARNTAGPGVTLSYVVAGFACLLAALCYAEFAALAPTAGSAYSYAYTTLGEFLAWIIGWDLILEYAVAGAIVAVGWSEYFVKLLELFGLHLPKEIKSNPFTSPGSWFDLPAVVIMAVVAFILVRGVRESARTNAVMVAVKVGVVLFVIIAGIWFVSSANWTSISPDARHATEDPAKSWGLLGYLGVHQWFGPVDDTTRGSFTPYGFSGIILGASLVFFAYIGFDAVSTHAEETRKPSGRNLAIGILGSLAICTVLYLGVALVLTGMVPWPEINEKAAVADAFSRQGGHFAQFSAVVIAIAALAGMTSVLLVTFSGQARIFLAMARDGLLPRGVFATLHPRSCVPHRSIMLTATIVAVIAAVTPAEDLLHMVSIGTLMAFAIVCAAVLMLRKTHPDAVRPFRCPCVNIVAPLGIGVNIGMMLFLPPETWLRLGVWLVIGLVVYFCYGRKHSVVQLTASGGA